MQWPMDVDFVKYLSGKSSKLLKVKHHDILGLYAKFKHEEGTIRVGNRENKKPGKHYFPRKNYRI